MPVNSQINITLKKRPSMIFSLWQGIKNNGKNMGAENQMPAITLCWPDAFIDKKRLHDFCRICDIAENKEIPVLYPFVFAYPCMLRMVSLPDFPFSMFKMLHVRSETIGYRPIQINDRFEVSCNTSDRRTVEKGIEFDLKTSLLVDHETIWENTSTFFFRKKTDENSPAFKPPRLINMEQAETIGQWYLPAKDRFRFARISGDSNGIHYSKPYAKMLGFQRDYAQPLRVAAKCVELLPVSFSRETVRLNLYYKGPVYYNSELTLNHQEIKGAHRFDLFCEGNHKPCIRGKIDKLNTSKSDMPAMANTKDSRGVH